MRDRLVRGGAGEVLNMGETEVRPSTETVPIDRVLRARRVGRAWSIIAGVLGAVLLGLVVWLVFFAQSDVVVPDILGMDVARATADLEDAGLVVGSLTSEVVNESEATSGTVLAQSPAAGTSVKRGAVIDLIVATGAAGQASDEDVQIAEEGEAEAAGADGAAETGEAREAEEEPEPEPTPEPEPAPEPAPEPEPEPEPAPTLTTILAASGEGDWVSAPFEVRTNQLTFTAVISSPAAGQYSFTLPAATSIPTTWVFSSTPTPVKHDWTHGVIPGTWRFHIDAPAGGEWSFKIKEMR